MEDCVIWLREHLQSAEIVLCQDVRAEAVRRGFTKRQLKDARKALDVKAFHQFDEHGDTGNHFWYLPEEDRYE